MKVQGERLMRISLRIVYPDGSASVPNFSKWCHSLGCCPVHFVLASQVESFIDSIHCYFCLMWEYWVPPHIAHYYLKHGRANEATVLSFWSNIGYVKCNHLVWRCRITSMPVKYWVISSSTKKSAWWLGEVYQSELGDPPLRALGGPSTLT